MGVLYIIGTVAGMLSLVLTGPVLGGSDFLVNVSTHKIQIMAGALFVLIMGLALAMSLAYSRLQVTGYLIRYRRTIRLTGGIMMLILSAWYLTLLFFP